MFEADLLLGRELAVLSADVAMEHFRRGVRVRRKADGSKVTDADLAVEAGLLELLAPRRPDDAILSEERGAIGASRRRWLSIPSTGPRTLPRAVRSNGALTLHSKSMERLSSD